MQRTQVYLTEKEKKAVKSIARRLGKTQSEVIRIAVGRFIGYLRGRDQAVKYLESLQGTLYVSAITVAELYSGVRDDEQEALEQFLSAFTVVAVDQALARDAGLCRRSHQRVHGVGLADAIVAMSAKTAEAVLVTFNKRHYPMVERLLVPYRRAL